MKRILINKNFNILAVIIVFMLIYPLSAQFYGLKRAGIQGGVVFPENWGAGLSLGARLDFGELAHQVYIIPMITYWNAKEDTIGMSNIALAADLQYFPFHQQEGAYIGVGMSYNFLSWDYYYKVYAPTVTEKLGQTEARRIGFYPIIGYVYKINQISLFAELKYNLISEFDAFQLTLGATMKL
jgi:hypothetical protein